MKRPPRKRRSKNTRAIVETLSLLTDTVLSLTDSTQKLHDLVKSRLPIWGEIDESDQEGQKGREKPN